MFSVHNCAPFFSGQAGLAQWWNMEQRGRSADTVYCQPLSASESLRESHSRSSTDWPTRNMISFFCGSLPYHLIASFVCVCVCVCAGVFTQVGACQSNIPVSSSPDRSAAAQCCLLRHRGSPAGLHGRPQTNRHPIYESTERGVSTPLALITVHVTPSQYSSLSQ